MNNQLSIDLNRRLAFHEKPYSDESLISWLTRLSLSNYISLFEFIDLYYNSQSTFYYELLKCTSLIDIVEIIMTTRKDPVFANFIKSNLYFNTIVSSQKVSIYSNNPSSYRKTLVSRPQICPKCFLKDIPYIRILWSTNLVFSCSTCSIYLVNSCENCNKPIIINKLCPKENYDPEILKYCYNCSYDLSKIAVKTMELDHYEAAHFIRFNLNHSSVTRSIVSTLNMIELILKKNKVGKALRSYFELNIVNGFNSLDSFQRAKVIKASLYFSQNFHSIVQEINDRHSLRMSEWGKDFY